MERSARGQEELIEKFFIDNHGVWAPSEIRRNVFSDKVPITSVRRGMTNLTNRGVLIKTETQTRGPYGRNEHHWRLAK